MTAAASLKLGSIARLGLGLMGISGIYSLLCPDDERRAFLDEKNKMGETFWDTSKLEAVNYSTRQLRPTQQPSKPTERS